MLKYDKAKKAWHAGVNGKYRRYKRLSPSEKAEIIRLAERSELSVNKTLLQSGINKSTL